MSTNLKTTPIMDYVNAILEGRSKSCWNAYKGDLSLSDLGVLEAARSYMSAFDDSEKLYGDAYGWVTVGEYIGNLDARIDSIMHANPTAHDLAVEYATLWRNGPYQGALSSMARANRTPLPEMLALVKHGCRITPRTK